MEFKLLINISLTFGALAGADESKDLPYGFEGISFLSFVNAVGGNADACIRSSVLGPVETDDEEDESVEDAEESTESSFLILIPFKLPMLLYLILHVCVIYYCLYLLLNVMSDAFFVSIRL